MNIIKTKYPKVLYSRDEINFLAMKKKAKISEDCDQYYLELKVKKKDL
jgi:hypothetical protein